MGALEQHISADISIAARQYLYMTSDVAWIKNPGFELLSKVGDFWVSKAKCGESGKCHIYKVVPPDEFADHGENDSIYTNWVAKMALEFAAEAADIVGGKKNPKWKEVADSLVLPFDEEKQAHPEFTGYKWGTPIKQADVVLLSYPLKMPMPQQVRLNDLELYAKVTDESGPAMTWGMHAIGYIMSGKGYEKQAAENFNRSFANVRQPFLVWSETPTGGVTNFITGAGGFLQTITFGYCGLRINQDHITLSPSLMEGATSLENRGLQYLGRSFTIRLDAASDKQMFTLDSGKPLAVAAEGEKENILEVGGMLTFPLGTKLSIQGAATALPVGAAVGAQRLFEAASAHVAGSVPPKKKIFGLDTSGLAAVAALPATAFAAFAFFALHAFRSRGRFFFGARASGALESASLVVPSDEEA